MNAARVLLLFVILAAFFRVEAQNYSVQELIDLPGIPLSSASLFEDGTVTLSCNTGSGYRAVTWRNGQVRTYDGPLMESFGSSSFGPELVVGAALVDGGHRRAAFWHSGVYADLGSLNTSSFATTIDAAGRIGGSTETHDLVYVMGFYEFQSHPFIYQGGQMLDLGPPRSNATSGTISSMNSIGQAVGFYYYNYDDPGYDSFIWSTSNGKQYLNGPSHWQALGINDAGQIVGNQEYGNAFLRQPDGTFVNFGATSQFAGINNQSDIVGRFGGEGVIWRSSGGTPITLDSLIVGGGPHIDRAIDINDDGQILGLVYDVGTSTYRSVLLNPVTEVPSVFVLFGVAAIFFVRARSYAGSKPGYAMLYGENSGVTKQ